MSVCLSKRGGDKNRTSGSISSRMKKNNITIVLHIHLPYLFLSSTLKIIPLFQATKSWRIPLAASFVICNPWNEYKKNIKLIKCIYLIDSIIKCKEWGETWILTLKIKGFFLHCGKMGVIFCLRVELVIVLLLSLINYNN